VAASPFLNTRCQNIRRQNLVNMADEEVAAKTAESKVTASEIPPPVISGDTPAQTGPAMGEHCVTDRPTRQFVPCQHLAESGC
jgi:hypothetical protein